MRLILCLPQVVYEGQNWPDGDGEGWSLEAKPHNTARALQQVRTRVISDCHPSEGASKT
jgi:hypothetical protein